MYGVSAVLLRKFRNTTIQSHNKNSHSQHFILYSLLHDIHHLFNDLFARDPCMAFATLNGSMLTLDAWKLIRMCHNKGNMSVVHYIVTQFRCSVSDKIADVMPLRIHSHWTTTFASATEWVWLQWYRQLNGYDSNGTVHSVRDCVCDITGYQSFLWYCSYHIKRC